MVRNTSDSEPSSPKRRKSRDSTKSKPSAPRDMSENIDPAYQTAAEYTKQTDGESDYSNGRQSAMSSIGYTSSDEDEHRNRRGRVGGLVPILNNMAVANRVALSSNPSHTLRRKIRHAIKTTASRSQLTNAVLIEGGFPMPPPPNVPIPILGVIPCSDDDYNSLELKLNKVAPRPFLTLEPNQTNDIQFFLERYSDGVSKTKPNEKQAASLLRMFFSGDARAIIQTTLSGPEGVSGTLLLLWNYVGLKPAREFYMKLDIWKFEPGVHPVKQADNLLIIAANAFRVEQDQALVERKAIEKYCASLAVHATDSYEALLDRIDHHSSRAGFPITWATFRQCIVKEAGRITRAFTHLIKKPRNPYPTQLYQIETDRIQYDTASIYELETPQVDQRENDMVPTQQYIPPVRTNPYKPRQWTTPANINQRRQNQPYSRFPQAQRGMRQPYQQVEQDTLGVRKLNLGNKLIGVEAGQAYELAQRDMANQQVLPGDVFDYVRANLPQNIERLAKIVPTVDKHPLKWNGDPKKPGSKYFPKAVQFPKQFFIFFQDAKGRTDVANRCKAHFLNRCHKDGESGHLFTETNKCPYANAEDSWELCKNCKMGFHLTESCRAILNETEKN